MQERILKVFARLDKPVDVIVIMNGAEPQLDRTFFYVTGLRGGLFEGCAAVLWPDGSGHILSSRLEEEMAKTSELPVEVFVTKEERDAILRRLLDGTRSVGVNARELTYENYLNIRSARSDGDTEVVTDAIVRARQVKDDSELASIRGACDIVVQTFEELLPYVEVGKSEAEIAAELVYLMQSKGATGPSFKPIVASGPNAALPHHETGGRRLQEGDFLLIDFGALYENYASDMTRTVVLGEADKKQRRMYEVVLQAQQAALDAMKAGVDGKEVYETAAKVIDATEFKDRFTHGLGHTVGLAVHDGAAMRSSESVILEEGMVMTVEPGVYLPGYGGVRIEDDVLITNEGVEVLTPATKEFLEV